MAVSSSISVDVCVSTYNHEEYVERCFEGILGQKCDFPVRILVHDDCSIDGTVDILREYKRRFPHKFHLMLSEKNLYQENKNLPGRKLLTACKAKYIACCDGDDFWVDGSKLANQVGFLEKNQQINLSFTSAKYQYYDGGFEIRPDNKFRLGFLHEFNLMLTRGKNCPTSTMVFRREVLDRFSEEYWLGESSIDFDLMASCLTNSGVHFLPEPSTLIPKNHPGSWSAKKGSRTTLEELTIVKSKWRSFELLAKESSLSIKSLWFLSCSAATVAAIVRLLASIVR